MNDPEPASQVSPSVPAATLIADMPPENVGSVIGPYKLLQQIGQGGFGVVYMAEQEKPVRRVVALKIIKPGMDTGQVIARFESERQALALMDHANIARVLDAGATASGHPYFVMELVKGVPITEFCDKNHLLPEARLKLFVDVCHAIQHAHHKGIIHRDIKPSNVMVTLQDGVPVVKVIDFGVAKATVQKLTERTLFTAYGQMVGTPEYMSPEQAEMSGLDIDTRSDVYSLGVLLYELLTGTTPLEAGRLRVAAYAEMQRLIQEEEPPRPSTRLSSLGVTGTVVAGNRGLDVKRLVQLLAGDLDWVAMKALEKDRNRRYATPGSFAEDVERYLSDEAIQARPPSTAYRLKKLVQRNRGAVFTAAIVALALLSGTAISAWQAVRATHAERASLAAAKAEKVAAESARLSAQTARVAAESEKEAKQEALARETETKAVLGFVENRILAAARPLGETGGLGREVTLRKAIESALPYVEKSFASQPLIEARLRLTLGWSFSLLGDAKTAAEQHEAARAIYTRLRGPDHRDTLNSMLQLARCYDDLGRYPDALELRTQALAQIKAKLGADHPLTLEGMNELAESYMSIGRHADARNLHERTLALRKAKLGADHPDTLTSMNNLARSYTGLGLYTEAAKLYEETVALMKVKLGPDDSETLISMNGLAIAYFRLSRYAEALKLHEEILSLQKAKLGPDHPLTLHTMTNLANDLDSLGQPNAALKLREETLVLQKAKLGPGHPDTLMSMYNLAVSYDTLGRKADALKLQKELLPLQKAKLGPDHPYTLQTMSTLAVSYAVLGRHAEGIKLLEETLAIQKVKRGPGHPETLVTMYNIACMHAIFVPKSTDRANEASIAMDCLQRAVAAGFNNLALIKKDSDLDNLRDREDFKQLVAKLEAGQGKGKKK